MVYGIRYLEMPDVTVLTDRFDRVLLYATHVHGGQSRKGTSVPVGQRWAVATVRSASGRRRCGRRWLMAESRQFAPFHVTPVSKNER